MPIKKINIDEFEETSEVKKRRFKLSALRADFKKSQMMSTHMSMKIKYFKELFIDSKYPEDTKKFVNSLVDEREMCVDGISEQKNLISRLEKM